VASEAGNAVPLVRVEVVNKGLIAKKKTKCLLIS
jgi:hypothetical protein